MEKIQLTETKDHPLCPYCENKLSEIHWHKVRGGGVNLGYVAFHSCPHCKKVLSTSAKVH